MRGNRDYMNSMYSCFLLPPLGDIFQSHWLHSPNEISKVQYFVFHIGCDSKVSCYIIIILLPVSFFKPALTGGPSLEFVWWQVLSGLFWVFLPIRTMLGCRWSQFILWFLILPVFFPSLWRPFQALQLQFVWPSPSCSIAFIFFSFLESSKYLSILSLSIIFSLWSVRTAKSTRWQFFLVILRKIWSSGRDYYYYYYYYYYLIYSFTFGFLQSFIGSLPKT